ncbi:DUF7537 family lipoprotein [Haloglomus halophilum]|uniref:DUF7537 family lipoprotein n=1 Tax=Haloglomus halophilum TaxID=2962672 RepID=UPI0020C9435D|nr:hypothetical protein [Haloglomus halophilum]
MTARKAAVLVVAVLVLLAGCTDGSSPAGPGGGSGDGGTDGAGGSDGGDGTGTDGFATTDREQVLREAGSFTATWRWSATGLDGESGAFDVTHTVDLEAGRSVTNWASSDGDDTEGWQQFHADGVTYTRYGSGEDAFYTSGAGDTDLVASSLAYGGLYAAADTDGLIDRGQERFDGVGVTRYELDESATVPWFAMGGGGGAGTVSDPDQLEEVDWTYAVLVDGNGLARQETWGWTGRTADGRTVSYEAVYSITAVGSTSVDEPAWLSEAKASAN